MAIKTVTGEEVRVLDMMLDDKHPEAGNLLLQLVGEPGGNIWLAPKYLQPSNELEVRLRQLMDEEP